MASPGAEVREMLGRLFLAKIPPLGLPRADRGAEASLIIKDKYPPETQARWICGAPEFMFMPEGALCFFESREEVWAFGIRNIAGTRREFADALASLLRFDRREWSVCGGVTTVVLNTGGCSNLIALS